jgi:tripartite-type tricarboxylate transporter receptor subunit TctC
MMAKIDMVHVPYKGAGPAVIDLVAGRIDLMIVSAPTVLGQIKAQRLRPLAVTSVSRLSVLPDVPTFDESGVPGYEAGVWWGLLAPAGTRTTVVDKLQKSVAAILQTPDTRSRISTAGAEAVGNTPKAFAQFIGKETVKWGTVIKAAGIKVE